MIIDSHVSGSVYALPRLAVINGMFVGGTHIYARRKHAISSNFDGTTLHSKKMRCNSRGTVTNGYGGSSLTHVDASAKIATFPNINGMAVADERDYIGCPNVRFATD
jgi:hypothetical protein